MRTSLEWLRQKIDQGLHSQKTLHTSPSRVSYGVSIVSILEKTDHINSTALYLDWQFRDKTSATKCSLSNV